MSQDIPQWYLEASILVLDAITALLMTNVDAQLLKLPLSQHVHRLTPQLAKLDTNGKLQLLEICSWQGIALSGQTYENNVNSGTVYFLLFLIPPTNPHKCLLQ